MDKTAIKNFSIWARNKLIADISYKAGLLGITEKEIKDPLPQSTQTVQFFDIGSREPYSISGSAIEQRKRLVEEINSKAKQSKYTTAYESVIEEVAYTWFNRLIAIRFMEVNDYLPTRIRVLSSESTGKLEPDLVTYALEADLGYTAYEKDKITQLKHENKLDELFRMLFIKQCNALNTVLPELFEKTNDYTELLFNVSFTDKDGVVYHLVNDIAEDDFNVSKEGQVEIIGWLYQYYNTEPKQAVFDGLKKNIKITKEKIPAATQLFTPNWIVRYMVENSLGRLWLESHPNDELKSNWRYYLDEAEQTPEVEKQLKAIRSQSPVKSPEDIRLIDPCMGSGHILVYAFDMLMQIYESEGYNPRDAARLILENNIYGLDIDRRAHQLAYFSLMMKARQYNRRIFSEELRPQVYHPAGFPEGEEYGSLVKVDTLPPKPAEKTGQLSFDDISYDIKLNAWNFQRLLAQEYDVVVTNPPYMSLANASEKFNFYVKNNYPDSKADFFAVFIEKCSQIVKDLRFQAMITQQSFYFISGLAKLRKRIIEKEILINSVHMGLGAFGNDFGTVAFVFQKNRFLKEYQGRFLYLGDEKSIEDKEALFLSNKCPQYYHSLYEFEKLPNCTFSYTVSSKTFKHFGRNSMSEMFLSAGRNKTHNDAKYLRFHWEIGNTSDKWVPYGKGGAFRRWYGNHYYVVDWSVSARKFFSSHGGLSNSKFWSREGITWSFVTSYKPSFRYKPREMINSSVSPTIVRKDFSRDFYVLGLLNSNVGLHILEIISSTIGTNVGEVLNFPVVREQVHTAISLVEENVQICKKDWDSFEVSSDFAKHPLLNEKTVMESYSIWKEKCEKRFELLKKNEMLLNKIFVENYNLYEEVGIEVEDREVEASCRRAKLQRDIKGLLSYAVGCMFGRYSLDAEGLSYAGGEWDDSKYQTFVPNKDNILIITDEEYFDDDIVGRFVDFVKIIYGQDTLEENLDFIADALGNRGDSSREIIRNYIFRDFFKDHCKIYQKRPIYWLFDSGKQNGFKALVYMHRYDENTVGNLRIDYLHKMQQVYENEISRMQDTIDNSNNSREVNAANKRKEKLIKQLQETKEYDEKIAHLALARVPIDLDDGVKVNYEKAQTDRDGNKYDVLAKIR